MKYIRGSQGFPGDHNSYKKKQGLYGIYYQFRMYDPAWIKPVSENTKPCRVRDYNHNKQNNYPYLHQASPADAGGGIVALVTAFVLAEPAGVSGFMFWMTLAFCHC